MSIRPYRVIACAGFCLLLVSGCSLAPDYQRPQMDLPEVWTQAGAGRAEALAVQWWKRFNDPVLDALIEEALANNRDMAAALARVDYARARLGLARADQLPSVNGQMALQPTYVDGEKSLSTAPYSAAFSASWELDFWGRYRNLSRSAQAQLLATEAAQDALRLSLAAQTAKVYFQLRAAEDKLRTAERTLKTRLAALHIYESRYKEGLISELDLAQSKTVVETARTVIYQSRAARENAEATLGALLGRSPRDILQNNVRGGMTIDAIPTPPVIPAGVPSELLNRRPDLRQAEAELMAATANIGVARADWFPSLSLTGALGVVSPQLADLFRNPLDTHSYGVSGSVPILHFGRISSNVRAVEASQREAMANYEQAVLNAFRDMRDALARQREASNIVVSLVRMVKQYRIVRNLASVRYDNGYSSYLDVLDAERSLFQCEMDLATARADRLSSIVDVCLNLGGGWKGPQDPAQTPATDTPVPGTPAAETAAASGRTPGAAPAAATQNAAPGHGGQPD